jgi:hypothetical protein
MPLFEFLCEKDGRFEALLPRLPDEEYHPCPVCDVPAPLVPSLPVMRPDALWAGHLDPDYGYVTSASQVKAEMKRRNHVTIGDRADREGMDRIAEEAQKAKKEKPMRDWRAATRKAFGPSGLGLGGADGAKAMKEAK